MDRRIETRVVDTAGAALTTLIQKDACEIWWITISPEALGTRGSLKIYDGFDADGKLEFQIETGYARQYNFIPPIPCDQGIYIVNDAHIACYTIGYRPKGWPKEPK